MKIREHMPKLILLFAIIIVYVAVAVTLVVLTKSGIITKAPYVPEVVDTSEDSEMAIPYKDPASSLDAAIYYLNTNLRRQNGHIELYKPLYNKTVQQRDHTNSEAISYYLQIMAQEGDKTRFDQELGFVERYMLHPKIGYMMWRLNSNGIADGEGQNIAPDADLRALRALYIAKDLWGDPKYDKMITKLTLGLEKVAIKDGVLVAYGGYSDKVWQAPESYLSYSDFQVYDRLANTRGGVWIDVAQKMRNITLGAQIWNGLYNSVYLLDGGYGSHIDGGHYSINSLWIMVRFAESGDPVLMESARRSLSFYRKEYAERGLVYNAYTSSGEPANRDQSPWNYALIARAAAALGEDSFAQVMHGRMLEFQNMQRGSPYFGAIIEGSGYDQVVGQFTMQESILTMQEIQGKAAKFHE